LYLFFGGRKRGEKKIGGIVFDPSSSIHSFFKKKKGREGRKKRGRSASNPPRSLFLPGGKIKRGCAVRQKPWFEHSCTAEKERGRGGEGRRATR